MPTLQQLLDTVDATYRNTYSAMQKIEWMDATQKQIFQLIPKEAPPYQFATLAGQPFYPMPQDCDRFGIKQVTIENKSGSDTFRTLTYLSVESTDRIGKGSFFYTVLENMIFLNPLPTATDEGKLVYILYNKRPATLSLSTVGLIPDLEEDFQELLILGCLERIARARGEIEDKNNFAADYSVLLRDYEKLYKLRQPEYYKVIDRMPRQRRGQWCGSRSVTVSDLIPPGLQ